MILKIFVWGRPGSGKSSVFHYISEHVKQQHKTWGVSHIGDYEILYGMYQANREPQKFSHAEYNGFDVLDLSVYDTALEELERRVQEHITLASSDEFLVIEFARHDYSKALKLLTPSLLQDAYVLFVETGLEICIQRIYKRAIHPTKPDDHFVSDHVLRGRYHKDNQPYIVSHLKNDFSMIKHVKLIDNNGSQQDFLQQVTQFIEFVFQQESGS